MTCPICNQNLIHLIHNSYSETFECPIVLSRTITNPFSHFPTSSYPISESHYQLKFPNSPKLYERFIDYPFKIDNYHSLNKSFLYKLTNKQSFKPIIQLPLIKISPNISKRIKTIIIFL
jgi:hypothetical protein